MANALYGKGRQAFLEGSIAYLSDNIKLNLLIAASYTPNINVDQFLSDIPGGAIVATSSNFASKTSTGGVADAADVTLTSVSGSQCSYIGIYKDTGSGSTSPLIALIDTATGLPVTPNGGDITVQWDNGANKIWKLFEGLPEGVLDGMSYWERVKMLAGELGRRVGDKVRDLFMPGFQPAYRVPIRIVQHRPRLSQVMAMRTIPFEA